MGERGQQEGIEAPGVRRACLKPSTVSEGAVAVHVSR